MSVEIGEPFPDFALLDQAGEIVLGSSFRGRRAVVFFYPKDATPG